MCVEKNDMGGIFRGPLERICEALFMTNDARLGLDPSISDTIAQRLGGSAASNMGLRVALTFALELNAGDAPPPIVRGGAIDGPVGRPIRPRSCPSVQSS